MELHKLILEKESPTEAEKILVIEHYIKQTKGFSMTINRDDDDSNLIEHGYRIAKNWFTENIDKI